MEVVPDGQSRHAATPRTLSLSTGHMLDHRYVHIEAWPTHIHTNRCYWTVTMVVVIMTTIIMIVVVMVVLTHANR